MRLASNEGARAYHSSLSGAGRRRRGIGLDAPSQRDQGVGGLAPGLLKQRSPIVGQPGQRRAPVAGEVSGLDGDPGRLLGQAVAGQPPVGPLGRLPPAPPIHRVPRERAEHGDVALQQARPGLRHPVIELGRVTDGESGEEPGDVDARGAPRDPSPPGGGIPSRRSAAARPARPAGGRTAPRSPSESRSCLSAWRRDARASTSGDSPQNRSASTSRVCGPGSRVR